MLTNILLTEDMEPKLSDFGLAKTLQMEETKVFTDVGGTIGYMDPEYINTLQAYLRASDIYSFGVVVLQLLSGRKVIELDIVPRDSLTKKVFIIRIIDLLAPALQRFCCGSSHLAHRLLYFGVRRFLLDRLCSHNKNALAEHTLASPLEPGWVGFSPDEVEILKDFYPKRSYYGAPDYRCNHCGASFWWRERKKQLLVKVIITRLGYDNCWWFLSCRECHKTTYVFGRHFRCSDPTCPSVNADPSYCVCTFGSDGGAEAEFMWFDKAARSVVGKPVLPLIERKYPGFTSVHDLAQIGGGDVAMPTEISRIVAQKYVLVVSISTKSFQPTSTQLFFQVSRIDQTFKPELPPLGFGGASGASGTSSSAENSGAALPILESFPTGSATLTALPLDEMNTPISAFKSKGQATMPKTPSKSPCPKNSRCKLFTTPLKITAAEVKGG
ncbi:uncharacterized protein [Triticum aestivum]|uniref:uncharacterized protein isoform X1 n=1 Tax=Triticum aestivum TaxID=4565 RepID=UPI001D030EF6|nr:uncharacterized protein LOC123052456 isoform X1 [Triticum aestivum]XP_044331580.1 uncharacterized protein LOC123052456 isoform X1 [Triticum aestivum]XP_044331581.1 uncharacterized protein LOC123052456 isoform X1 [Triticum aestivum]XP_044331582.1 uncharacterized protein LOC123052456 isoform X1 [Triticum aestivum]XP_044331583.1 uncharacterized protein LOC123052456 isoform X1 [Triticum aestivum]